MRVGDLVRWTEARLKGEPEPPPPAPPAPLVVPTPAAGKAAPAAPAVKPGARALEQATN
eukprot:gene8922-46925_t